MRRLRLAPLAVLVGLSFALASGCSTKPSTVPDDALMPSASPQANSFANGLYSGGDPLASSSASSSATQPATMSATQPATPSAYPTSTPVATPTPTPTASSTPAPTPAPSVAPSAPPKDLAFALRATVLRTQSHGLFWKTLEATVQVQNPLFLSQQSGTVVVTFTKNGTMVETQQFRVILDPAMIRDYSVKSTKNADAASADVITD